MNIGIETIENFSAPLASYPAKWIFYDERRRPASREDQKQITLLTKEAANFLWDYESKVDTVCTEEHYKNVSVFDSAGHSQKTIKDYLAQLGIPLDHKVYVSKQKDIGFVLTWEMLIKYAHHIFWGEDQTVWDRSMNWKLEYHLYGEFTFGKELLTKSETDTTTNDDQDLEKYA